MVLPQAETERHCDRRQRDDQPRAQLIEVINEADAVLVTDLFDGDSHALRSRCWTTSTATTRCRDDTPTRRLGPSRPRLARRGGDARRLTRDERLRLLERRRLA